MRTSLEANYQSHHQSKRRGGFAILEKERGELFRNLIGSGKDVLDLGCRDGVLTRYFTEHNRVTGADIDSVALQVAQSSLGIQTLHFDIQSDTWPVNPASFDVVAAGELLEHVYFPEQVIAKIRDIIRPGGVFVGSVPHAFALKNRLKYALAVKRGTPLEDPMHINHFSWKEMEALLAKYFTYVRLIPLGNNHLGLKTAMPSLFAYGIAFQCTK